ncbi:amino acid efflux protein [Bacillus methanolicus PB1]|uniref:Amino acid efflux protein n=1 Tax=Bacillus methanolicus PB1 TaxID=997296 RepID=I3E6G7_BACMT|nr:LysE family transporter [Bacillus methanolicus]EIJ82088.1 amino acid efflux protein [Bacillus methanolicus PB1]
MDYQTWMAVMVVGFLIVLSPGPQWAITIKNSLLSREYGFITVMGMCTGSIIHITYSLLGIGVVISQSVMLFNLVKWVGVAYLIFIGLKSFLTKKNPYKFFGKEEVVSNKSRGWKYYRMGLLTSLLNPKATLFYLSLFTQVVQPDTSITIQFIYGVSVVGIEILWYCLMVMILSNSYLRKKFLHASNWIERISGGFLVLFGIRLAFVKANQFNLPKIFLFLIR